MILCHIEELDGTPIAPWMMPHAPRCGEWIRIEEISYAVRGVTYTAANACEVQVERYANLNAKGTT